MPTTIITSDCCGPARGAKPNRSASYRGVDMCIISMAQPANPKVTHIREPVRAHPIKSSAAVTRKPLAASPTNAKLLSARSVPGSNPLVEVINISRCIQSVPASRPSSENALTGQGSNSSPNDAGGYSARRSKPGIQGCPACADAGRRDQVRALAALGTAIGRKDFAPWRSDDRRLAAASTTC